MEIGFIIIIFMVIVTEYMNNTRLQKNKNENLKGLQKSCSKSKVDNAIIFGMKKKNVVYSKLSDDGHVLVVGGSGSGKTSSIISTIQSITDGCYYCIDVAGDISKNIKHNKNTKILSLDNAVESSYFNLFDEIDNLYVQYEKEAKLQELASMIATVDKKSSDTERYYNNCAQIILKSAFLAFYDEFRKEKDYCKIFDYIAEHSWKELFTAIDNSQNETAKKLLSSFANDDRLNSESYATLIKQIEIFISDYNLRSHLKREETAISAKNINDSQIFVVIKEAELHKYSSFLKIITSQILQVIRYRENLINKSTLLILDELSSYGFDIKDMLLDALQRTRKKNVRIMLAVQSLSDLHKVFNNDDDVQSALNNCDYTMIMNCNSVADADRCQRLIGEQTIFRKSYTKSANSTSTTKSENKENAVSISELRQLKNKKRLILIHSNGFCRLKKYFYYENCQTNKNHKI